ncbi:unnamed protein product [Oppiella nova]|uniref:Uncharacterized protein n=1 Tax=Oppiella nova TaxID=334625 RepID=A0A7R9L7E6_9ACAR|nr:unnamed protein product [Oppiella nova]CAG2156424.1 unnamed protein product [Oppiella nova]
MLRQGLDFFHNDFAGRLSAKVMQTALAVRRISKEQADARAVMTGRVTDAYTNIQTGQAAIGVIAATTAMILKLNSMAEFMMWQTSALFENVGTIQDGRQINIQDKEDAKPLIVTQVAENIKYGRPDATDEEMYEAVRKAKADEFIPQLSDLRGRTGYDAYVDAPILILDEATSALDSEVEAAIQSSLDELMQNKTVIAIAHRLSTIAQMDRLIVLDQGQIAEQGTHEELIAQNDRQVVFWLNLNKKPQRMKIQQSVLRK